MPNLEPGPLNLEPRTSNLEAPMADEVIIFGKDT
jgi:hypothetical protein